MSEIHDDASAKTGFDHQWERGWQRYGFDNQPFTDRAIHGSDSPITLHLAFNRGVWQPHITFATIPPDTPGQAIGMHVHRDVPSGKDVEEWYIIIDGTGEMTFSNGDVVEAGPGDMLAIWPGTGHSFRAIGGPVRLVSITPQMFTSKNSRIDEWPEEFTPRIRIVEVDDAMNVLRAVCTDCGAEWVQGEDDRASADLPVWAREHEGAQRSS